MKQSKTIEDNHGVCDRPEVCSDEPVRNEVDEGDTSFDEVSIRYVDKFLRFKATDIQASDVSQYRLMPSSSSASSSKNR